MTPLATRQQEVDANHAAFKEKLPELLRNYPGKFALMQNGEVVSLFDTARDALSAGNDLLEGHFSVQEITNKPVDLGYFSHAGLHW